MATNKQVRLGPLPIAATIGNLFNPPVVSGGVGVSGVNTATYLLIKHLRIVNKSAAAVSFTGYVGATGGSAAGTEVLGGAVLIPANGSQDFYPVGLRLDIADFFTGIAGTATTLVISGTAELGIA